MPTLLDILPQDLRLRKFPSLFTIEVHDAVPSLPIWLSNMMMVMLKTLRAVASLDGRADRFIVNTTLDSIFTYESIVLHLDPAFRTASRLKLASFPTAPAFAQNLLRCLVPLSQRMVHNL